MNTRFDNRRSAEQAAEHLYRVGTAGKPGREAFAAWLLESRRNVRQALFTLALEQELKHIDPQRRFDVDAMLRAGGETVVQLESPRSHPPGTVERRIRPWAVGIAAAVAAAAVLLIWTFRAPVIQTATGEQQSIQLEDGSVVHLNTQSKIRISFSGQAREVSLLAGEALFSVEQDPRRPFRVRIDGDAIQALGTQFNVDRHGSRPEVSVVEGSVRVWSARGTEKVVQAGEEVGISADGEIDAVANPDIRRTIAWRERRLEFQEDPLNFVVAEFNRYNRTLKLRVGDVAVGRRTYTGIFRADDPESLTQVLSEEEDLIVVRTERETVIRRR